MTAADLVARIEAADESQAWEMLEMARAQPSNSNRARAFARRIFQMSSDGKKACLAALLYLAGVLITYGHAANAMESICERSRAAARARCSFSECREEVGGFLTALFWPLHWSREAWK